MPPDALTFESVDHDPWAAAINANSLQFIPVAAWQQPPGQPPHMGPDAGEPVGPGNMGGGGAQGTKVVAPDYGQALLLDPVASRGGRTTHTAPLPIGTEQQILDLAERRLAEGPRIVGSKAEREAILRTNWAQHGRDLDYDDPGVWEELVSTWNREYPDRQLDIDTLNLRREADGAGGIRTTAWDENGPIPGFQAHYDKFDASLRGKIAPYPGAKAASEYFESDPDTMKFTAYTSMRQIPEDYRPPRRQ